MALLPRDEFEFRATLSIQGPKPIRPYRSSGSKHQTVHFQLYHYHSKLSLQ